MLSARTIIAERRRVIAGSLLVSLLFLSGSSFIHRLHNTGMKLNPSGFKKVLSIEESSDDPQLVLAAADRFYWLNNGLKAAPLYTKAERLFAAKGDAQDEIMQRWGV